MEHEGYSTVRIEGSAFSKPKLLCLWLSFFAAFAAFLTIGAFGPDVWVVEDTKQTPQTRTLQPGLESYPFGADRVLHQQNQIFAVQTRISHPALGAAIGASDDWVSATLDITLTVTANNNTIVSGERVTREMECDPGASLEYAKRWCSWMNVMTVDLIDATQYVITQRLVGPDTWTLTAPDGTVTQPSANALVSVQTRLWYVNESYTNFEMGWKYLFVCITFVALLLPRYGYVAMLRRTRRSTWSFQQKWTLALLVLLFFFNDPLFAARIFTVGDTQLAITAVYMLCVLVFMAALLLWWLCVFADMCLIGARNAADMGRTGGGGGDGYRRSLHGCGFWSWKLLLVCLIMVVNMAAYFYYRYNKWVSPEYDGVSDAKTEGIVFAVLLGLLMAVYMLWLVVLIVKGCRYVARLSSAYQFLYFITLLTMLVSIIGVFTAAFYPWSTSGVTFLGFHGLYNLYIWTLAFAYAPVPSESVGFGVGLSEHEMMSTSAPMPAKHIGSGYSPSHNPVNFNL